jgi:lipopolysaccharide transport system permease protein
MISNLRELVQYRELLWRWVVRNIKVRYKQSVLGAAWAILQPLSTTILFTLIFSYFLRIDTGGAPYPIFYYSALLPWTFFASSISFGVQSLVSNLSLVTKIYFPKEILPISTVLASLVDFLVAATIYVVMMILYRIPVGPSLVLLPVLLVIQMLLTVGVVLLASALNVFYRDFRFVVPLATQLWMYLTPIIYPVSQVPERFRTLYMVVNPMAGLIDAYRHIVLAADWPQYPYLLSSAAISLTLFLVAYWYFKKAEPVFADII